MSQSILDKVNDSQDVKRLSIRQMKQLATELRQVITETVFKTGGHFASNLGTVELTLALHHCFNFPSDVLIWDVGHQCYSHKLITGRKDQFHTLRQFGGLTGFPNRQESPHDPFTTGHAGTSISTALGIAVGFKNANRKDRVIAVIGDGAMTEGMAFEAVNHAGSLDTNLLVILNDNKLSISKSVGALSNYLNRILMGQTYQDMKKRARNLLSAIPGVGGTMDKALTLGTDTIKRALTALAPGVLFEELGFQYYGPIDGHDLPMLIETFRHTQELNGPILLHVVTKKGIGHAEAEKDPVAMYARSPQQPEDEPAPKTPSYSRVFGETLVKMAEEHDDVMAVTAAMPSGTGLDEFSERFPGRYFDVAIAEQHAIGLASGIWASGAKPYVGMYSTFLQRGYDQMFQEISLQGANVVFGIDRAGFVGDDGPTHHGVFDIAFLRPFPNISLLAPMDGKELEMMLNWSYEQDGAIAIRYPRGSVPEDKGLPCPPIRMGKGVILREGRGRCDCTLIPYGEMVLKSLEAAEILARQDIECRVINPRFAKPLDEKLIGDAICECPLIFTMENHVLAGGFGTGILEFAATLTCKKGRIIRLGIPDDYVEHGTRGILFKRLRLDPDSLADTIRKNLKAAASGE